MSTPIINDSEALEPKNLEQHAGRWATTLDSPVVLVFSVTDSGSTSPHVSAEIDWGDGSPVFRSSSFVSQAQQQFTHVFPRVGDYTITVSVSNSMNEQSDPSVIPLRIVREQNTQPISKYRALALPIETITEGVAVVEDVFAPEFADLALDANQGDTQILVQGDGSQFVGSAVVVITETNKLVSSARVVETDKGLVTLDRALKDSYTIGGAQVTINQRSLQRGEMSAKGKSVNWYFPQAIDRRLIRSAISMVLSTAYYERPMRNSFGSNVHEIPFDKITPFTEEDVKTAVARAIETWEPRVSVINVETQPDPHGHSIKILVTLREVNDFAGESFVLDFDTFNPASSG